MEPELIDALPASLRRPADAAELCVAERAMSVRRRDAARALPLPLLVVSLCGGVGRCPLRGVRS